MLSHYFLFIARNARRAPLSTAGNIVTLALGLLCFLTAFAFVSFWQRAEQHFEFVDRIAVLTSSMTIPNFFSFTDDPGTPGHAAAYLAADFPSLERIARAIRIGEEGAVAADGRAFRAKVIAVDPEFLEIFDFPFQTGSGREALKAPESAVLTSRQATELFGRVDPIGRTILVDNSVEATITGVLQDIPEPSHFGQSASASMSFDVLVSMDVRERLREAASAPASAQPPQENWLTSDAVTYMLLPKDGTLTVKMLRDRLDEFTSKHLPEGVGSFATISFSAVSVRALLGNAVNDIFFVSTGVISVPSLLFTLGLLVLFVSCINYANLATARAARRQAEVGLRKALGAKPSQIVRQHLLEATVHTVLALALALVIVGTFENLMTKFVGTEIFASLESDFRLWLFVLGLAAVTTLMAGAYPALVLSRIKPMEGMRAPRTLIGPKVLSNVLVGVQFSIASLLLIAVIIATLQNRQLLRTGLQSAGDVLLVIENDSDVTLVNTETLRYELERLPEVRGVTGIGGMPWESLGATAIARSPDQDGISKPVVNYGVNYDFFSVFDIPVIAGRVFSPESADVNSIDMPAAIVVDRAFTERFDFATPQAAVNEVVYLPRDVMGAFGMSSQPLRIIGVVENRYFTFLGPTGVAAAMYQFAPNTALQIVRIPASSVAGTLTVIDAAWRRLSPNVPIRRRFLDEVFDENYATFSRVGRLFAGLSAVAVLIAVSGLFAMSSLVTSSRLPEIGIRKAHGAKTSQIVVMLLAGFGKPVIIANLLAWPIAYVFAKSYLNLFIVSIDLNLVPFVFSLLLSIVVASLAVSAHAVRASHARPADVLRHS